MSLRMEIARMFHGWPWELLAIPVSEYRRLRDYYYDVRDAEDRSREALDIEELHVD